MTEKSYTVYDYHKYTQNRARYLTRNPSLTQPGSTHARLATQRYFVNMTV